MKQIFILILFIGLSFNINAEMNMKEKHHHDTVMDELASSVNKLDKTITIAVLLYDDVVLQDFAGPMEVFSKAKNLTKGHYTIFTVAQDAAPISTENNVLNVTPDYTLDSMPDADYLIIPGASMPVINTLMQQDTFNEFIINASKKENTTLVSICTGAYLLADTGLLDNKKATTHYFVADDFSKQFPSIELIKNVRFVDEGQYISSSGISSGIDVALYIVGQNSGDKIKAMIARALQYNHNETALWPIAPNGMHYNRE